MARHTPALAAVLFAAALASPTAFAARDSGPLPTDLTPQFRSAGLAIDQLQVFEIGGIVVIRGKVTDRTVAEHAGAFAQSLGYARVANLVQVVQPPDDAAIERLAERELGMQRSLDGCRFHIHSEQGVVRIAGQVRHELQKDIAIQLLRNIDGVKAVRADLRKQ